MTLSAGCDINSRYVAIYYVENETWGFVVLPDSRPTPKSTAFQRVHAMYVSLCSWLDGRSVDRVWIEEIPYVRNMRTFRELIAAQTATALAFVGIGARVEFINNKVWKKQVIGDGGADKQKIAAWVEMTHPGLYRATALQDVYDAYGVFVCGSSHVSLDTAG